MAFDVDSINAGRKIMQHTTEFGSSECSPRSTQFSRLVSFFLLLNADRYPIIVTSNSFSSSIDLTMPLAVSAAADDCNGRRLISRKLQFDDLTYVANGECVEKEKQISVDPISLRQSSVREDNVVPVISAPDIAGLQLPPPLPPTQFKFLSYSLSNLLGSSPRFAAGMASMKKRGKSENQESTLRVSNSMKLQPGLEDQQNAQQVENHLRRSKSCGDGRASAPADDLDLWLNKPNYVGTKNSGGFSKAESNKDYRESARSIEPSDDEFKCGALCLFLPGFSKGKTVRSIRKEEPEVEYVISRTVSLEKFECGSWASSVLGNDTGDERDSNSTSLFFDLPMELIRNSVDTNAPVNAAFIFDKDRKGILKNNSTKLVGKSHELSHHVRFSTSSSSSEPSSPASCITPRLRKAREEFNAFLEAQSSS